MKRNAIKIAIMVAVLAMSGDTNPPCWQSYLLSDASIETLRDMQRNDSSAFVGAMFAMYGGRR